MKIVEVHHELGSGSRCVGAEGVCGSGHAASLSAGVKALRIAEERYHYVNWNNCHFDR